MKRRSKHETKSVIPALGLGLTIPAAAYKLTASGYAFEASNDPVAVLEVDHYGETVKLYVFPDYTTISLKGSLGSVSVEYEYALYDDEYDDERGFSGVGMYPEEVLLLDPNHIPFGDASNSFFYRIYIGEGDDFSVIHVVSQTVAVNAGMMDGSASTPAAPAETAPSAPDTPSTPAAATTGFPDVAANSAFAPAISWAVENGITTGKTDGTFAPNENCTNGQILTFLWRANGSPEPTIDNPFTDSIPASFQKAAVWASEKGLVSGGVFGSDTPCTRSMVVTYLWQLAGSPAVSGSASFPDVASGAEYAQAVTWAVENGITTGKTDGTFAPGEVCTRGQIVTFLYRDFA